MTATIKRRTAAVVPVAMLIAVAALADDKASPAPALEEIYVLRSIREPQPTSADWCSSTRIGFVPFAKDAERFFSFWSVRSQAADGMVVDAKDTRVADLHACFGATNEPARQNFYAEGKLGAITFDGRGECAAVMLNVPETGLYPVHCHLKLSGMPAPYVGGLLTTNTMTSNARFGAETDPPGYTQASIATVRLWKAK